MIKVASLFAGIGGFDLAFKQIGCDIVWANEKDVNAAVTYRNNFATNHLVDCDIRTVDALSIPDIDILTAGFPCQPFSIMGHQKGFQDPRGFLFFDIARIIKAKMPKIVLLENVKNILQHDRGKTFSIIYNTLIQLGYAVKYKIMNATDFANIPQDRSRIFIVAFLDHSMYDNFSFPVPIELSLSINHIINRSERHSELYYYNNSYNYYETLKKRVIDTNAIYRIDDSGIANRKYLICPTLKANMGTYHDRVPIIKDNFGIRKLTPMECLKFQGFPSDFAFTKISLQQAYKQTGNTICLPLVRRIAEKILFVISLR